MYGWDALQVCLRLTRLSSAPAYPLEVSIGGRIVETDCR